MPAKHATLSTGLIGVYELVADCLDRSLPSQPFPAARLRGLLGQCIRVYSRTNDMRLYEQFFKPRRGAVGREIARKIPPPKPYAIHPPTLLREGVVQFRMVVFGLPNELVPQVLRSLRRDYGKLHLLAAWAVNDLTGERRELDERSGARGHTITYHQLLERLRNVLSGKERVGLRLTFLTPVRLTRDGADMTPDSLRPSDLVRYCARRLFLLDYLYYSAGRALPFKLSPETVTHLMGWSDSYVDVESGMEAIELSFMGKARFMEGSVRLEVPCAGQEALTLLFLLRCCEYLGIGKHTVYGFGRYALTYSP